LAWWLQLPHCCARSDVAAVCPCPAPCPISDRGGR
jgi:hypothetical protein